MYWLYLYFMLLLLFWTLLVWSSKGHKTTIFRATPAAPVPRCAIGNLPFCCTQLSRQAHSSPERGGSEADPASKMCVVTFLACIWQLLKESRKLVVNAKWINRKTVVCHAHVLLVMLQRKVYTHTYWQANLPFSMLLLLLCHLIERHFTGIYLLHQSV